MKLTKAIVLSETDFRCIISDIADSLEIEEIETEKQCKEIANALGDWVLNQEDVDCLMVYCGNWHEIYNEDMLEYIIKREYLN